MNINKEESLFTSIDKIGFILFGISGVILMYGFATQSTVPTILIIPITIIFFLGGFLTLRWLMTDPDKEESKR